jgi:hypothetical protein
MPSRACAIAITLVALLGASSDLVAQAPSSACPTIRVSGAPTANAGTPIAFRAVVTGGGKGDEPLFNWMVSAGTIQRGQGTPDIQVNTAEVAGDAVTATVAVMGFPPSCRTDASATTKIVKR